MKPLLENRPVPAEASFLCAERDERHFDFNWHFHNTHELVLITEGHGQRFVGDHIGHYRQNDLVLVGRNLPHSWASSRVHPPPRNRAIYIQFVHDFLGPGFFATPELKPVARLLERAGRGLQFTGASAQAAIGELKKLPGLKGLARLRKLLEVLHLLADAGRCARPLSSPTFTRAPGGKHQQTIEVVLAHVHSHITQNISLEKIAAMARMTRSTFCRFFKRVTGKTLVEYVNNVRIGRACSLLTETDLSVSEICFQSGFSSLPYFNRRFLATKQTTPSAYRQNLTTRV